jgi:short-subunit dehydrogenase
MLHVAEARFRGAPMVVKRALMRPVLKPIYEQVIVITGATSGIGLATARKAADAGAALVLSARNTEALAELTVELRARGARVEAVVADIGDPAAAEAIALAAETVFGGFDTWVNNAGVSIYGKLEDIPLEDQRRLFETNYWGLVYGSLAAVKRLRARRGGAIVNVGSVLSDQAIPIQGAYSATKHAVKGFTNALRMELLRDAPDVAVTLIKPSAIDTPYKLHARNYMPGPGTSPGPYYSADLVAGAILHAAEHPTREITVGGGGRALAVFGQLLPAIAEPLFAWTIPALSRDSAKNHPDGDTDALYEPGRDLSERAPYPMVRRYSLYTRAQLRPEATAAALGGLALGLLLMLKTREALKVHRIRRDARREMKARYAPRPPAHG